MGEFELIRKHFLPVAQTVPAAALVLGPGDDCAIQRVPAQHELVFSIDTMVEGVHFPTSYPADRLAWRALAAATSDLAAMGADPVCFTLAVTLPAAEEPWLSAFSRGLASASQAFGLALAPRVFQADLLTVLLAAAAVTVMRVGPRLAALKKTTLPRESQMFLAWFGGAPGAASALFLISLLDAPSIVAQDAVLTVGALAVLFGVFAARLTSRPLVKLLLKQTALAKKRAMFAG